MKRVKFGVSGHISRNTWREWPEDLHADLSWPPWKLIRLGLWSGDLSYFGAIWLSEMGQIWGFQAFPENPLRKWPGILLADESWASSELSELWLQFLDFSNFGTILTSLNGSNWGIFVMLCECSSLWCPFDWNWSYLGFLGIIWRTCGDKCQGGSGGIFPTLCVEFCQVHL